MEEQIMVFSKEWFKKHNKTLCWFANTPIVKYLFRKFLFIDKDLPFNEKINEITPNSYIYGKKLILTENGLRWKQTTSFRTHEKFGKRLYYGLKPLWYLFHFWDWSTAVEPKLNLGFDSLTVYPVPGTTVDGQVGQRDYSSGSSWATLRAAAGNYNNDVTADYVFWEQASNSTNLYNYMQRGIFLFDTSSLSSSAIISQSIFWLYGVDNKYYALSKAVHLCSSNPASNSSLANGDYDSLGSTSFGSVMISSWSTTGYNSFVLNANGIANISKTGISKFGTRGSNDINNTAPTWASSASSSCACHYSNETGTTYDPKLDVTYTLPVIPTVTTQSATNIATTSCTGNGNITATGGENCTRRGFCYKVGTTGDPTTSDSVAYDDGSFGTGAFTKSITGLTPNTSYRVRAYAVNSAGTSYGTTVDVKTLSSFIPRTMWFN